MTRDAKSRDALLRVKDVFIKRPQTAMSSIQGTAVVEEGLRCSFTQGEHSAVMDLPEIMGGDNAGPTPGFFGRAGIAGCVSIGIKEAAIMAGLAFDRVSVDIETDFDDSASFGLGTASAAPLETRLTIHIKTAVPASEVSALIDQVLGRDPWFLALRDAQAVKTQIQVQG
ncbi:MAG: OsmC family protein [Pseudomonadota bacterium]